MLSRVGLVLALWLTLAGVAHAADIQVTRTDDRVGGTCAVSDCTLREAIASAQAGDTVQLAAGQVHALTQGAQLTVNQAITIAGAAGSRIDGTANADTRFRVNRIMRVNASVTIRDVTFSGGRDGNDENFQSCSPCDTITANGGGAIFNTSALTLTRVVFEGNQNSPTGGAVGNAGSLTLDDVEFHGNAASYGAALFSRGGTVTANGVTMDANEGTTRGAVYVLGGTMLLENATVTGNGRSNTIGGGVVNGGGALTLRNVTIADNLRGGLLRTAGTTSVANSILASGCVPAGQFGAITAVSTDLGHNLDEDNSCALTAATTVIGQARLAPLNANGGATPTMAVLTGSPALDAIPVQDCAPTDQRGVQRVGPCDIGAFEAERLGQPTVVTEDAGAVEDSSALLSATVGSADEGGKLSFEWGMAPETLGFRTPGVGVRAAAPVARGEAVYGFPAGTRIYYRAVAENASGIVRGAVKSFTTKLAPPTIQGLDAVDVGDETVTLRFTIDPGGAGAGYRIRINDDDPPLTPLPGGGTGPREITRTIPFLAPNTNYRFQVEVTNADHTTASDDGIIDQRTLRRFSGTAGAALTVGQDCAGDGEIAWGDGSSSPLVCADDAFSATHTYATAGRHRVKLAFERGTGALVTHIEAGAGKRLLSVNVAGKGRVSGNGIDCPGVCSAELPVDAAVALTATAGDGETFQGWGGFCHGTGACELELGSDASVVADFSGILEPPGLGELHVSDITATSARVGFLVDPNGVSTSYRLVVNGTALASVAVGAGSGPAPIGHQLTALQPSTRYAVRVIATNGGGETSDETVFTTAERGAEPDPTVTPTPTAIATAVPTAPPGPTPTPTPAPAPQPTVAVDVVGAAAGGTILVKLPRTNRFVALTAGQELPYGTEVDARRGRVRLTSIPKAGAPPETAEFYDGLFRLSYVGGITNLTLSEPLAPCKRAKGASAAAQKKKAKSRKLWGKGKGSFRTTGKHSAATVRGTTWLVQDTCAGTLTRVTQGAVTVRHGKKNVIVRAGKKYLAKAR